MSLCPFVTIRLSFSTDCSWLTKKSLDSTNLNVLEPYKFETRTVYCNQIYRRMSTVYTRHTIEETRSNCTTMFTQSRQKIDKCLFWYFVVKTLVKATCCDLGEALESISYSSFHCRPVSIPGLRLKRHFSPAAKLVPSSNDFEVILQPGVNLVLMSIVNRHLESLL